VYEQPPDDTPCGAHELAAQLADVVVQAPELHAAVAEPV
jgi:hypothetical protein